MEKYTALLHEQKEKLLKALSHLEYSYKKIGTMPQKIEILDEASLATWESFSIRFARVVNLFLTRYLRTFVLNNDPGFSGSLRDFVNQGEKLGLINKAETWMRIRELRNISAHEYTDKDLNEFFHALKNECPHLLGIKNSLS